jgi:hypothetical protein
MFRHTRLQPRHHPRPPLKLTPIPLLQKHTRLSIQRTARIRLHQQTAYRNQNIPQRQLDIPIPFQRFHTNSSSLIINIRMEYLCAEICFGGFLGVCGGDGEVEFEDAGFVGCGAWAC